MNSPLTLTAILAFSVGSGPDADGHPELYGLAVHEELKLVAGASAGPRSIDTEPGVGEVLFWDDFGQGLDQWQPEQVAGGSVAARDGALVIQDVGGSTIWFRPHLAVPLEITFWNDRVRWKFQFNAQNLFSETGLRPIGANPDGSAIWARNPDRVYELSNGFDF